MKLPPFQPDGMLPPGIYPMTLRQLEESFLVTGDGVNCREWDSAWRGYLTANLKTVTAQLRESGVGRIFIGGSFLECNPHPNDIDGYFECDIFAYASQELQAHLNALDPFQSWDWRDERRIPDPTRSKAELPLKRHYHIELYPYPCLVHALQGPICPRPDGTALFREDFQAELGRALVNMRLHAGLSHRKLAARLEMEAKQLRAEEESEYRHLTLEKARQTVSVLVALVDRYPETLRRSRPKKPFGLRRSRGLIEII